MHMSGSKYHLVALVATFVYAVGATQVVRRSHEFEDEQGNITVGTLCAQEQVYRDMLLRREFGEPPENFSWDSGWTLKWSRPKENHAPKRNPPPSKKSALSSRPSKPRQPEAKRRRPRRQHRFRRNRASEEPMGDNYEPTYAWPSEATFSDANKIEDTQSGPFSGSFWRGAEETDNFGDGETGEEGSAAEEVDDASDRDPAPTPAPAPPGYLHKLVGQNGALMISMPSMPWRFEKAAAGLAPAGIYPTFFNATDATTTTDEEFSQSCADNFRSIPVLKAIVDSHYRALKHALERSNEWTAIFEDDAYPVAPDTWDEAFKEAWAKVPSTARFVRLQWMSLNYDEPRVVDKCDMGMSVGTQFKGGAGLTGAYMVHKSVIPDMLERMFPCRSVADSCFVNQLFHLPANPEEKMSPWVWTWAEEYVAALDHVDVHKWACWKMKCCGPFQHGVIIQSRDDDDMQTTHPGS